MLETRATKRPTAEGGIRCPGSKREKMRHCKNNLLQVMMSCNIMKNKLIKCALRHSRSAVLLHPAACMIQDCSLPVLLLRWPALNSPLFLGSLSLRWLASEACPLSLIKNVLRMGELKLINKKVDKLCMFCV
jgi:hypothetical protein